MKSLFNLQTLSKRHNVFAMPNTVANTWTDRVCVHKIVVTKALVGGVSHCSFRLQITPLKSYKTPVTKLEGSTLTFDLNPQVHHMAVH